jgi:hypothetical protein
MEPELRAMITVYEALQGLDNDAKIRDFSLLTGKTLEGRPAPKKKA